MAGVMRMLRCRLAKSWTAAKTATTGLWLATFRLNAFINQVNAWGCSRLPPGRFDGWNSLSGFDAPKLLRLQGTKSPRSPWLTNWRDPPYS